MGTHETVCFAEQYKTVTLSPWRVLHSVGWPLKEAQHGAEAATRNNSVGHVPLGVSHAQRAKIEQIALASSCTGMSHARHTP